MVKALLHHCQVWHVAVPFKPSGGLQKSSTQDIPAGAGIPVLFVGIKRFNAQRAIWAFLQCSVNISSGHTMYEDAR